jgi:CHRD domain
MPGVRRVTILALSVAALLVFGVSSASAVTYAYTATLSGANEVPPNASAGTGTGTVTWNTVTHMMTVSIMFTGLTGTTTASHIHCCVPPAPPDNAIVATTTPTFPGFPLGVTSGSYLLTFDMTLASSYNPAFITAHGGTVTQAEADLLAGLLAGQAYLNIHTNIYPGGEIRGNLVAPTAVQVERVTATKSGKKVRIRWRTGSDSGMLGFNVYRGIASHRTRATRRLIPAVGRVAGATYSWVDRRPGSRYWLQVVHTDGSKSWYGPARVR